MTVIPIDGHRRQAILLAAGCTDMGNAERLLALHGEDLHYLVKEKHWYLWTGARWTRDDSFEVDRRAKDTIRRLRDEAPNATKKERQDALAKWAHKSESNVGIENMLRRARAEPGISVAPEEFDAHPLLLNCANGVVDLTTGDLKPHDRALLLTKHSPVAYSETAECPRWLAFVDRVFGGDTALIAYIQRAVGYSLTADTREQCLHLLYGHGANGKSTFLETLAALFGDYALQTDFSSFLEQRRPAAAGGARSDLARLNGARLVRASEIGEGKRFDEALIKTLTGNEVITARFQFARDFEFAPTFKLWFSSNHKPVIRGTDHAIWRRLRLIPFTVTIPDSERDYELPAKLKQELPGILAWAVRGAVAWRSDGLKPPESVLLATADYRSESDVLGAFMDECCELDDGYSASSGDLYGAFKRWAEAGGEYLLSQTVFGRRLEERGFKVWKSDGVKRRRGIRLNDLTRSGTGGLWNVR